MKVKPPKIDERDFNDLLNEFKASVPHYTPEWTCSDEKDAGVALSKIFTHMTSSIIQHFNQVPHKNFVAFLDMLGFRLLPAQSARVPLTFKTAKGTENEIFIPVNCPTIPELILESEHTRAQLERFRMEALDGSGS